MSRWTVWCIDHTLASAARDTPLLQLHGRCEHRVGAHLPHLVPRQQRVVRLPEGLLQVLLPEPVVVVGDEDRARLRRQQLQLVAVPGARAFEPSRDEARGLSIDAGDV